MIKINEAEVLLAGNDSLLQAHVQEVINQYTPQFNLWYTDSGQRALNYIFSRGEFFTLKKRTAPRLVIVSLNLNDISGKVFLASVKNNEITKAVPVIVVGSKKDDIDKINFYRLGVNSYLVRPVIESDFRPLIKKVMDYWLFVNQPAATIE
jgi:two-component system response regulator